MFNIYWMAPDALTPNRRNARTHSRKQIGEIAASITAFGFVVPIAVDEKDVVLAGHVRHAAAKLGLSRSRPSR
jgi:ParB-like chromosome segregation protein Spo0J